MDNTQSKPPEWVVVDDHKFLFHNPYNLPYFKKSMKVLQLLKSRVRKENTPFYNDVYASFISARNVILGVDGWVVYVRFQDVPSTQRQYAVVIHDLTNQLSPLDVYYPAVRGYNTL